MAGLTALQVKNAKPGRHADGGGLYLLVRSCRYAATAPSRSIGSLMKTCATFLRRFSRLKNSRAQRRTSRRPQKGRCHGHQWPIAFCHLRSALKALPLHVPHEIPPANKPWAG
jgi:hypothetical protein